MRSGYQTATLGPPPNLKEKILLRSNKGSFHMEVHIFKIQRHFTSNDDLNLKEFLKLFFSNRIIHLKNQNLVDNTNMRKTALGVFCSKKRFLKSSKHRKN